MGSNKGLFNFVHIIHTVNKTSLQPGTLFALSFSQEEFPEAFQKITMAPKKILVVDDDSNLLDLIGMRLELTGYEVVTALNEDEAMARSKEGRFALSIVDLKLVRMDGIALMEEMHSIHPDLPVIILTAHGSVESAVEAMKRGAFNYLNKPFDPQELLFQIKRAMEVKNPVSQGTRLEKSVTESNVCKPKRSVGLASALTPHDVIGKETVLSEKDLHGEPIKSFKETAEYFTRRCLVRLVEMLRAICNQRSTTNRALRRFKKQP